MSKEMANEIRKRRTGRGRRAQIEWQPARKYEAVSLGRKQETVFRVTAGPLEPLPGELDVAIYGLEE